MPRQTKANPALSNLKRQNARKQLRKERYRHLLDLGFTSSDARKFRDHSSNSIDKNVESERQRITKVRAPKRSETDTKKIREIRRFNRQRPAVEVHGRNKTRSGRWEEFSQWTSDRNFPEWAQKYIGLRNREQGFDPLDSWGYRRFYYRYVQNRTEGSAARLADRDDS